MTPEQRSQFYERMVNRQMDRLTQAYELDDTQKQQVRQRMEALREEDMSGAQQRYQQMSALRDQYRQLGERRAAGEQIGSEQWQQLDSQMRGIMRSSPLRNNERIMGEVEQYLPPDQAAKGHDRMVQQQAERERQFEARRQQFQQLVEQGGDPREFFRQQRQRPQQDPNQSQPQPPPVQPTAPEAGSAPQPPADAGNQETDRQRRREERQRRREEWRQANGVATPDNGGGDQNGGQADAENERRWHARRSQELPADPLGPWERYVRDYIAKYDLDASQQAVAQSILRDLLKQRSLFEETHRADIAIVQQVEDPAVRRERLESVNAPVVRMFDELKSKLERIPTAAQRLAVDGPPPTSRPAGATTRPAGEPSTRPARERRGQFGNNPDRPRGPGRRERE